MIKFFCAIFGGCWVKPYGTSGWYYRCRVCKTGRPDRPETKYDWETGKRVRKSDDD